MCVQAYFSRCYVLNICAVTMKQSRLGNVLCITDDKSVVLCWGTKLQHTKTIPLDPSSNVGIFRTAPGFSSFMAFCKANDAFCDDHELLHCFPVLETESPHVIPNDESEGDLVDSYDQSQGP